MKSLQFFIFWHFLLYFKNFSYAESLLVKEKLEKSTIIKIKESIPETNKIILSIELNSEKKIFLLKNKISPHTFEAFPTDGKLLHELCQNKCEYKIQELPIQEQFNLIHNFIFPQDDNQSPNELKFSKINGLTGMGVIPNNTIVIDKSKMPMGPGFSIMAESFRYKKNFSFFSFGFSLGGNLIVGNTGKSKGKILELQNEFQIDLNNITLITFQEMTNFHLIIKDIIGIFVGFNLNLNFVPYLNEWEDEMGKKYIFDISGGMSAGYQAGINILIKDWFLQFKYSNFKFPITTSVETEFNKQKTYQFPQNYNAYINQLSFHFGINF